MLDVKKILSYIVFLLLISGCNDISLPPYIEKNVGEKFFYTTNYISCFSAVYSLPPKLYDNISSIISKKSEWKKTPVEKSILDGMNTSSKILYGGMQCNSGLEGHEKIFLEAIEGKNNDYIFWGNSFILIIEEKNMLFVVSYS